MHERMYVCMDVWMYGCMYAVCLSAMYVTYVVYEMHIMHVM